jgi:hypothetical protein
LITFTEKAVGIISERNRESNTQIHKYLPGNHQSNSNVRIEEDEDGENVISNKSSSIKKQEVESSLMKSASSFTDDSHGLSSKSSQSAHNNAEESEGTGS